MFFTKYNLLPELKTIDWNPSIFHLKKRAAAKPLTPHQLDLHLQAYSEKIYCNFVVQNMGSTANTVSPFGILMN